MFESEILSFGTGLIKQSYFLRWIYNQVDSKEEFKYQSVIFSFVQKPVTWTNALFDLLVSQTYISTFARKIDLKSVVLFFFIVAQVIFPGYGTADTGVTLLPGSPAGSLGNQSGFVLDLIIFSFSIAAILVLFARDVNKHHEAFNFSRFEIIILLLLLTLGTSTFFSAYISISFPWLIKICRGLVIYFIFSRLKIERRHLIVICFAFLAVAYFESILAVIQYIHGGFIGSAVETAGNISTSKILYTPFDGSLVFRATGTLTQSNILSFFFGFILPFSLFFLFSKGKLTRILSIMSTILCFVASIFTLSRWGTLTLLFSLVTFLILTYIIKPKKINSRFLLISVMVLLIVLFITFITSYNLLTRFSSFSGNDTSLSTRMQLIIQSLYVIQHNFIFGIGGGTFAQYMINNDFTPLQISRIFPAPVHNSTLLIISESGLTSFLLLITGMFYFLLFFLKNIKRLYLYKNNIYGLVLIAMAASSLTYLFNGMWEIRSLSEHLGILLWMNIGLFFGIIRSKNPLPIS